MDMIWYKMWTKRFEEKKSVKNGRSSTGLKKIYFINAAYAGEVDYWKRAALGNKNEEERKRLTNLAPSRIFLVRKDAGKSSDKNIHEMLFYLRKNHSTHT